ncbi:hypothetical protein FRC17_001204 [Serendipita sp. 399]|nr:hypothetical protein FRC17_001204 [Serendipita sp. 399]
MAVPISSEIDWNARTPMRGRIVRAPRYVDLGSDLMGPPPMRSRNGSTESLTQALARSVTPQYSESDQPSNTNDQNVEGLNLVCQFEAPLERLTFPSQQVQVLDSRQSDLLKRVIAALSPRPPLGGQQALSLLPAEVVTTSNTGSVDPEEADEPLTLGSP